MHCVYQFPGTPKPQTQALAEPRGVSSTAPLSFSAGRLQGQGMQAAGSGSVSALLSRDQSTPLRVAAYMRKLQPVTAVS